MATWSPVAELAEWVTFLFVSVDARVRPRVLPLVVGALFAHGRRTVSRWLVAAGVGADFRRYYYALGSLGRKVDSVVPRVLALVLRVLPACERALLVVDDSLTKRYGPRVEGAGVHHNPTPGPAGARHAYGHSWVTLAWARRHPLWGAIALPLWSMLYVRAGDLSKLPAWNRWPFRTKLELAAELLEWAAGWFQGWLNKPVIAVVDGAYAKRPFLKRAQAAGVTVVSRLRKDAALFSLPTPPKKAGPNRPPCPPEGRRLTARQFERVQFPAVLGHGDAQPAGLRRGISLRKQAWGAGFDLRGVGVGRLHDVDLVAPGHRSVLVAGNRIEAPLLVCHPDGAGTGRALLGHQMHLGPGDGFAVQSHFSRGRHQIRGSGPRRFLAARAAGQGQEGDKRHNAGARLIHGQAPLSKLIITSTRKTMPVTIPRLVSQDSRPDRFFRVAQCFTLESFDGPPGAMLSRRRRVSMLISAGADKSMGPTRSELTDHSALSEKRKPDASARAASEGRPGMCARPH